MPSLAGCGSKFSALSLSGLARAGASDSSNSGRVSLRGRPPSQLRRPPLRHGSVQASARLRAGCHPSTELRTNGKGHSVFPRLIALKGSHHPGAPISVLASASEASRYPATDPAIRCSYRFAITRDRRAAGTKFGGNGELSACFRARLGFRGFAWKRRLQSKPGATRKHALAKAVALLTGRASLIRRRRVTQR